MAEKQPLTNGSYGATTKPATPTGAHSMDLLRTDVVEALGGHEAADADRCPQHGLIAHVELQKSN